MLVEGCLACDVLAGKTPTLGGTIYENIYWVVDHSVSPALLPGYLIIKPKRHCEQLADLTLEETATLGPTLRNTCQAILQALQPAKVYVWSFGDHVKHVNIHVVPRYPEMPGDGLQVFPGLFEGKWACSDEEATDAAVKVRQAFQELLHNE